MPYVHYVPVKNDQSDLIEKIDWLKANDEKAREIAENGKELFEKLYSLENMIEDVVSLFSKYESMMKYEPEAP